jgi:SAM-dependent methyltransferase
MPSRNKQSMATGDESRATMATNRCAVGVNWWSAGSPMPTRPAACDSCIIVECAVETGLICLTLTKLRAATGMTETEILLHMYKHAKDVGGPLSEVVPPEGVSCLRDGRTGTLDRLQLQRMLDQVARLKAGVGAINPRPKGWHNSALQFVKRGVQRMLSWYTCSLQVFHNALTEMLSEQMLFLTDLDAEVHRMNKEQQRSGQEMRRLEKEQHRSGEEMRKLENELIRLRLRFDEMASVSTETSNTHNESWRIDFDYASFEEKYRGSMSLVKERQRKYVALLGDRTNVLDLGCGRGEFLELLREAGIPARGVDNNQDFCLQCKDHGLDVIHGDLLDFLESVEDESLGGVIAAQVIEHLPIATQLRLVDLCYLKLKSGSPIIIETINPECVFALARNFYMDPTHVRPVPAEFLQFVFESKGFTNVRLEYSAPVEGKYLEQCATLLEPSSPDIRELANAVSVMNHFLYGRQDYAAIGFRP